MARNDDTGDGSNGGGGDGLGGGGPAPSSGITRISSAIPDSTTLLKVQQRLDAGRCITTTTVVESPDGGFLEYRLEAYCPEDAARDLTNFILQSLSERRPDGGTPRPRDTPLPRDALTLERIEARIAKGETIAEILLTPPREFSALSRKLATDLLETIEKYQFLGKTIVVGVVILLATAPPQDTLATGSFDLEPVAEALQSLPRIAKAQMRQQIQLALAKQPPPFSAPEEKWWTGLDNALK